MKAASDGSCPRREAGRRISAEAAALALDWFEHRGTLRIGSKSGPQDLVSDADRAVERAIRKAISEEFPDDGLMGEEHADSSGSSGWTWVIDPIDGTAPFLHGLRSWSVSIAVLRDGVTEAGWVCEPCSGRIYEAARGRGATLDGTALRVSTARSLSDGLTALGSGPAETMGRLVTRLLDAGGMFQRNGSAALSLAHVAAGHYLGFFEPRLSPWDCLAGLLLVREAGGRTADYDPWRPGPVLAAAPDVFPACAELVGLPA